MRTAWTSRAACLAALLCAAPAAGEPIVLRSGAYAVAVRVELPHLETRPYRTDARVCLSSEAGADNHGFAVLSANNPLVGCPVRNVYADAGQLAFDIACEGRNAARAKAHYTLRPDGFDGRIVMQMGGKNMTMTEVQAGRRTGACDPAAPSR
ncbi:DUF3617 family protein [Methylobacterium sp. NEAU 140]|uniref:DUF3617 domain-containing protein n=1 Tax=Methylobacterium sp. NEAU 140 TaxID=3064945 RepID=UPI0027351882|nr:DUF3617 family protein [Methylobacterium sp. NEAU 140]MDP4025928.1 DUF3617 family protein [Methylobacterium sp. NEAU 140]